MTNKNKDITIFQKMTELSVKHNSINLGQGFPDEDGPSDIIDKAAESLNKISNQYPPMRGLESLRKNISTHIENHYKISTNWESEIMITNGATEALASSILALTKPEDEVIIFEPAYDSYKPIVEKAGGIAICIPLTPPDWEITYEEINKYINSKSKLIILNNPMNPLGKVFNSNELNSISKIVNENNMYVISDEVHEHIIFDGRKHLPIISIKGLENRSIKIGSAGKTFSLTGWKIGFIIANEKLINLISNMHQYITFTAPPNLQEAIAYAYQKPDCYYENLKNLFQNKRDLIYNQLKKYGVKTSLPDATYFINIDYENKYPEMQPENFCLELIKNANVTGIPISVFYDKNTDKKAVSNLIRLCFAKNDEILIKAANQIGKYLS
tara:strand:- start:4910 stop:6064 length:1155 start_codon:yes stop_codon:yes gene_type:complete